MSAQPEPSVPSDGVAERELALTNMEVDDAPPEVTYSRAELAAAAGVTERAVTDALEADLLPPARTGEGGQARFDETHLERLGGVSIMRERGLDDTAIAHVLRRVDRGKVSLQTWLDFGTVIEEAWADDPPMLLNEAQLAESLRGHRGNLSSELIKQGLIEPRSTIPPTYLVGSPGLLEIVLELEEIGVEVSTAAPALNRMRRHLQRAADALVGDFVDRAGRGFGRSPEQVADALADMNEPILQAVRVLFTRKVYRALRERSEQFSGEVASGPRW